MINMFLFRGQQELLYMCGAAPFKANLRRNILNIFGFLLLFSESYAHIETHTDN